MRSRLIFSLCPFLAIFSTQNKSQCCHERVPHSWSTCARAIYSCSLAHDLFASIAHHSWLFIILRGRVFVHEPLHPLWKIEPFSLLQPFREEPTTCPSHITWLIQGGSSFIHGKSPLFINHPLNPLRETFPPFKENFSSFVEIFLPILGKGKKTLSICLQLDDRSFVFPNHYPHSTNWKKRQTATLITCTMCGMS